MRLRSAAVASVLVILVTGAPSVAALGAPSRSGPMIRTVPSVVVETTNGDVAFAVQGRSLARLATYVLSSPGLDIACDSNTVSGTTRTSDLNGNFFAPGEAFGCAPGTFGIVARQQEAPFRSFGTTIMIRPPRR